MRAHQTSSKWINSIFCATLMACFLATPLAAHQGATGIVKDRMDKFSQARNQMRQMGRALQNDQFEDIADISAAMQIWAKDLTSYFPDGSQTSPTEAADSVWQDKDGFAKAASVYKLSLIALNEAALGRDRETVISAYQKVGLACKSCHQIYRQR